MKKVTLKYDEDYNLVVSDEFKIIGKITDDKIVSEIVCSLEDRQFNRLDKGLAVDTSIDDKYLTPLTPNLK